MIGNTGFGVRGWHFAAALAGCAFIANAVAAEARGPAKGKGGVHVQLQDATGKSIARAEAGPGKSNAAVLMTERAYQPGDRIVFGGVPWMAVRVDNTIPECFVFGPRAASEDISYEIPWGREEKQTGSAYDPESFGGTSHRITLRALSKREISGYRNLALNPCDVIRKDDASVDFYPHASSNSVSRSLFDFEARKRNFVHVTDLVEAMLMALDHPKARQETFNICMDEPVDYREMGNYLNTTRGLPSVDVKTPYRSTWLDNTKAKFLLGWRPRVDLSLLIEEAWTFQRLESDPRRVWYPG